MDFRQLHYMLKVAEEKSFSKAAKKLYISQPSLSQYISNVEQQLGVRLFDRTTNPLTLTYAGELYEETAKNILYLKDQLLSQMDDIANLQRGHITIGISPFRSTYFLPTILPLFKKNYPGIDVSLAEGTMAELLELAINGATDFSIMTLPIPGELMSYDPIMTEEIFVALPPNHYLCQQLPHTHGSSSARPKLNLGMLRDEPFIILKQGQRMNQVALELCKRACFKPKIILETKNIEAAHALVAAGMGITFIPDTLVGFGNMTERPVYFSLEDLQPTRTIVIAYRKGRYLSKAARKFIAMTKAVMTPTR